MSSVWKCPAGHLNSFRVTENSPDINCIMADEAPCEECLVEFDDKTWKFVDYEYDEVEP